MDVDVFPKYIEIIDTFLNYSRFTVVLLRANIHALLSLWKIMDLLFHLFSESIFTISKLFQKRKKFTIPSIVNTKKSKTLNKNARTKQTCF